MDRVPVLVTKPATPLLTAPVKVAVPALVSKPEFVVVLVTTKFAPELFAKMPLLASELRVAVPAALVVEPALVYAPVDRVPVLVTKPAGPLLTAPVKVAVPALVSVPEFVVMPVTTKLFELAKVPLLASAPLMVAVPLLVVEPALVYAPVDRVPLLVKKPDAPLSTAPVKVDTPVLLSTPGVVGGAADVQGTRTG